MSEGRHFLVKIGEKIKRIAADSKSWLMRRKRCIQYTTEKAEEHCLKEKDKESEWSIYNPCNPSFRNIIEQIIAKYEISYQKLQLAILDVALCTQEEQIVSYEESYLLAQLLPGLNSLTIYTQRPEYFQTLAQTMLEENGLVVEIRDKYMPVKMTNQVLLDFEQGTIATAQISGMQSIYLPIYKRPWEIRQNLDIRVPIGYNTVIVKGTKYGTEERFQDRIEREFYTE